MIDCVTVISFSNLFFSLLNFSDRKRYRPNPRCLACPKYYIYILKTSSIHSGPKTRWGREADAGEWGEEEDKVMEVEDKVVERNIW